MLEYVIGILGVVATFVGLLLKWVWDEASGNGDKLEEEMAARQGLESRLYGNDRGQSGDINDLQGDVQHLKKEIEKIDKIQHTVDQIRTDQVGNPDVDGRTGTLNEVVDIHKQLDRIEGRMESEHQHINEAIRSILESMDDPPEITYPKENPEEYRNESES